MKKPEIKYESWCHECKRQGTVHCKVCRIETLNAKNLAVLHRPYLSMVLMAILTVVFIAVFGHFGTRR